MTLLGISWKKPFSRVVSPCNMVPVPKTRKECVFVDTTLCFYEHLRTCERKDSVFKVLFNEGTFSYFNMDPSFRGIDWEQKLQHKKPYSTEQLFIVHKVAMLGAPTSCILA